MSEKVSQNEKNLSKGKILIILFIVFILVPIFILSIVYSTNDSFKLTANTYLAKLPGPIGYYFKSYPTEDELMKQLNIISDYLVGIEENRAKDKLILIKNENEKTYSDLIQIMLRTNQSKTTRILEEIRKNTIKEDIIISTLEDIDNEKTDAILENVKYFENLSIISFVDEVKSSLENGVVSYRDMSIVFENMKDDTSANLLNYLDEDITNTILNNFTSNIQSKRVKDIIVTIKDKELYLENMAEIYSSEPPNTMVDVIGNTTTYDLNSLSTIYRHLGVRRSALILSKVEDKDFLYELINKIKEVEILTKNENAITEDLTNSIKIYREFDKNVIELSSIYDKMDERQAAQLITRLIRNNDNPKKYTLNSGDLITLSDEALALEILRSFNDRKIGIILSFMDNNLSSEISKKLAYPSL